MDFTIQPLRGVGRISFGTSPDQIRREVGGPFKSFKRSPEAAFPCDYFDAFGTFFYYDSGGRLDAIEFVSPAQPTIHGVRLLEMNFRAAKESLMRLDSQIKQAADSIVAYQIGVSVWSPLAKSDPLAPIESVLIFRQGYFN